MNKCSEMFEPCQRSTAALHTTYDCYLSTDCVLVDGEGKQPDKAWLECDSWRKFGKGKPTLQSSRYLHSECA